MTARRSCSPRGPGRSESSTAPSATSQSRATWASTPRTGDIVAFIDDDAIPEARWLDDLARAYTTARVGGAGGLTLDNTGTRAQYRYSVCDRIGITDFDRPPFDRQNRPSADPYVYLQGTNCSFRRSALADVEGFDEEIEYNCDESEVCSQIVDSGLELRPLEGAVVHHHFLPSHMRRSEGFTDPFLPIKNRVYIALRVGRGHQPVAQIMASLVRYLSDVEAFMRDAAARGRFTEAEESHFMARAQAGFEVGLERGLAGVRRGRAIAQADAGAFVPYPVLVPEGRRLAVCFVSMDYPPRPLGGVGRYTHDLARGFAAAGHEAHVVTRDDAQPYRVDYEEGVWVHRFPVASRWTPELDGHALKGAPDPHPASTGRRFRRGGDRRGPPPEWALAGARDCRSRARSAGKLTGAVSDAYTPSRFHVVHTAPAWMPLYERVLLHALTVGLAPQRILEIGTFQGGSTLIMCAALDDLGEGRLVCVDPDPRLADETWESIRHRATIVAGPSPDAVAQARAVAGDPFDFALIDGDHSREGVDRDIDATVPVLADDAHMIFHDAHYHEVREAIDAALERHSGRLDDAGLVSRGGTVDENGVLWGGLRLLRFRRSFV